MQFICRLFFFVYCVLCSSSDSVPHDSYAPFMKKALILGHPNDRPFLYIRPSVQISMYDNVETLVHGISMRSRASTQTSGCHPDIAFEGCSSDAKRPTLYLSHEFVKIRVVPKNRSALCKNLKARFNKPAQFFERQSNDDLTFEQREEFFKYNVLYAAVFWLEVLGSYQSVIGEELVINFNVECFFKIHPPHSIVSVDGGSGTFDCAKPVEFRPIQTELAFKTNLFTLRWSCEDLENPNSEQCQPVETVWGIKTYTLECDRVYRFKLEPSHEYFKMQSSPKSNVGTPFEWVVETAWGATHVTVRCIKSCYKINPLSEVNLEAVEFPHSGTDLVWMLFEENEANPLPLSEYTTKLINKWTLSIKGESLKEATRYRVVAETSKGRGEIIFTTNSPPQNGTCSIVPTVGIKGNTKFSVGCQNWTDDDKPILYTVGVVVDGVYVALVDSFYPDDIPPVVLFFDTVLVTIQDSSGMVTSVDLKVVLLNLGYKVDTIHSKGDFSSRKIEVITDSIMASIGDRVNTEQKFAILGRINEILPFSKTVNDLEGLLGCVGVVMKRLSDLYMGDGVHKIIKLAGQSLRLASDVLLTLCTKTSVGDFQIKNVIRALMSAAAVLFQTRDPYLLDDSTASLDVQEVHRHQVKLGVKATLEALGVVLEVSRLYMTPNFGPVRYDVGHIVIFTSIGKPKTLQTQLDELGQATATIRLSQRTVALMGHDTYAVEVIATNKEAYWWKPISGQVLHSKFFKRDLEKNKLIQIPMDLGPFDIPINIDPGFNAAVVQGVANRAMSPRSSKSQRFITIHRIKLPPGQGAVSIEWDPIHFGQIKMITIQDSIPAYSEIDSMRPVNRTKVVVKYDNQGLRFISNFYIAVISAKEVVYKYEFKVHIGRCAYYVSDKWQSQGCQFKGIVKTKNDNLHAACQCNHLSTVGYRTALPVPDLPNFDDLSLLFSLKDNWIVVAAIGLILLSYFFLLIYGALKDKQDHRKEALTELPDNYPGDTYPYIVIFATGIRCRAGTSSKVAFQLFGSHSRSRPHLVKGGRLKDTLNRGCDDWLLLFTRKELGEIEEIVVWHSNTGCSQDWYCSQITVYDVKNDKPYAFKVGRWFKIDPQNLDESKLWRGKVDRVDWEVRETKPAKIFGDRLIMNLKDQHDWASIFLRHPRSVFTRCERIAALGSMIFSSMLTSVVYFGSGDFAGSDVPDFSFNLEDFINMSISFLLGLIVGKLLSVLTLSLFNLSKQKLKKPILGPPVIKKRCCGLCKFKQKAELFDHIPITTNEGLKARDAAKPGSSKCLRFLAWIVIFTSILAFSFFIILYGLRFGKKRSLLWIQTVMGSLLVDAVIYVPAKMVIKAYLASRRQGALAHDYFMEIDPESLWPEPMHYYQRVERMWCRLRKEYKPLSHRRLLRMSKLRAISDFFYKYIVYFVFMGTMFAFISFFVQTFDTKARYQANTALLQQLTEPRHPEVLHPREIVTAEEFADYVNKTLITSLHRHRWYNGELLPLEPSELRVNITDGLDAGYKGWCVGLVNKIFGAPRLRQQRVTTDKLKLIDIPFLKWELEIDVAGSVSPYFTKYFKVALNALAGYNKDKNTYKVGWTEYNKTRDKNLTNLWSYSDKDVTVTGPYFGRFHTYDGEGYVELLYWSRAESAKRFFEVINEGWIDNKTRAIFVEVNLYNVDLNFFSTLVVLAERAASGVFHVGAQIESTKLIATDPFRTTWMYMTYVLIPLLLIYVVYYFQESSSQGIATLVSWQGFINLAIIMMSFKVINLNFDKATRFNVFADRLNTALRDQFTPLYVPFYNELMVELFSAGFGLSVCAAMASAVYRLLGYGNFKKMFVPVQAFMVATIVVNAMVNTRSSAAFKTLGIVNLNMEFFDTFFKSMPHDKLNRLSHNEQSIVIIFIPFCFFFVKTLLGAVIFYYDRGADEIPRKIGFSSMFVRRPTDPELHKQLDKQDKVLEKKMDAVTKKLTSVSKKYKKKKDDQELYHAKRKSKDEDEPAPKGWLEAVWSDLEGHNLEDLEGEPYQDLKLPPGFDKGFQPAEYKPPELQELEDKKNKKSEEKKNSAAEKKKSAQQKADDVKKSSASSKPDDGSKKSVPSSTEDKKSSVPKSVEQEKKSIYKDVEDRKKSEVPKPADDKKKSEVPKSVNDVQKSLKPEIDDAAKKPLVSESTEDKKKSIYKDVEGKKKSELPKPIEEIEKSGVPKPADHEKKSEMPKSVDDVKKSVVSKSTQDQQKSTDKSVEDRLKYEEPKSAEKQKKTEVPKSADDMEKSSVSKPGSDPNKLLVPKTPEDKKSVYKDAEDRKKSVVPKVGDDEKKSLHKDTDVGKKLEVSNVGDQSGSKLETPVDSKKSKFSNLLNKMSNVRKGNASDSNNRKPGDTPKENVTSKEPGVPKTGDLQGEGMPSANQKQLKPGGSGAPMLEEKPSLNISGAASMRGQPGVGAPPSSIKPGDERPGVPPTSVKPSEGGPGIAATRVKSGVVGPSTPPPIVKPGAGGPGSTPEIAKPGARPTSPTPTSVKPGAASSSSPKSVKPTVSASLSAKPDNTPATAARTGVESVGTAPNSIKTGDRRSGVPPASGLPGAASSIPPKSAKTDTASATAARPGVESDGTAPNSITSRDRRSGVPPASGIPGAASSIPPKSAKPDTASATAARPGVESDGTAPNSIKSGDRRSGVPPTSRIPGAASSGLPKSVKPAAVDPGAPISQEPGAKGPNTAFQTTAKPGVGPGTAPTNIKSTPGSTKPGPGTPPVSVLPSLERPPAAPTGIKSITGSPGRPTSVKPGIVRPGTARTGPGVPRTGKPSVNVTWEKPEADGATDSQTRAKPGAPPSRRMEYRGPGIPPGIKIGTTLGSPRMGPGVPPPRKPLDWIFNRAKSRAPPLPQATSLQRSQPVQKRPMVPEERTPKRPRPDATGPNKPGPQELGRRQWPRIPPPGQPPADLQGPGIPPPLRGPQDSRRPPGGPQQRRGPPRPPPGQRNRQGILEWLFNRRRR